jgi:hypothetical protein
MSQLGDVLELMHQASHRAPPFDITIESRSRRGTTLVRVRRADGRRRVDEAPEGDRGGPSTLVEADGRWLVTRADGTASTGEGATTTLFDGPWMPVVDLVIDPSPLLSQLEFDVVGERTVGERPALVVRTRLRADEPFGLMGLPAWYDMPLDPCQPEYRERTGRYEIAIDARRGILLDVVPLAPGFGTERLTVTARFDPEFDADTFSTVPPAGSRITKIKSMWTARTLAGMAVALLTPRTRLIARAERDRLARISARPPGEVGRGPQGWRQGSDDCS